MVRMADLTQLYHQHKDLSEEQQKKAGVSPAGDMGGKHVAFVMHAAQLVKEGQINVFQPETFFKDGAYGLLSEEGRTQADLALVNIADQLRHVVEYYLSDTTPDASPQLEQMIEHLWQMKERLEQKYGPLLKF